MRHILLAALLAVGLSCDDEHSDRPAECEAIVEACHAADKGPGDIHECHENAEATWTKDQCVSNSTRCTNLCKTTDAGS